MCLGYKPFYHSTTGFPNNSCNLKYLWQDYYKIRRFSIPINSWLKIHLFEIFFGHVRLVDMDLLETNMHQSNVCIDCKVYIEYQWEFCHMIDQLASLVATSYHRCDILIDNLISNVMKPWSKRKVMSGGHDKHLWFTKQDCVSAICHLNLFLSSYVCV